MAGQNRTWRDQRPGLDPRDQRLYRRVLESADAGHGARSHAGAFLANGDTAAVGNCTADDHTRPAGDVRYARRTLLRSLRRTKPSRDRRSRDRTWQQARTTKGDSRGATAKAVAADRASRFRLRVERVRRHDYRLPAPHSPVRTRRLRLDRLQWSRGGAFGRPGR